MVLGPFHVAGALQPAYGADISAGLPGERLLAEGVVPQRTSASSASPLKAA